MVAYRYRLMFVLICFFLLAFIMAARLAYWQVWPDNILRQRPDLMAHGATNDAPHWRGTIFDRNGYPLAVDVTEYDLDADTRYLDPKATATFLSPLLKMSATDLETNLSIKRPYLRLARSLQADVAQKISAAVQSDILLRGLHLKVAPRRYNPAGSLAGTILGYVNADGKGVYGLESMLDDRLRSQAGSLGGIKLIDPLQFVPARNGTDIYLTIDRVIQDITEQVLFETIISHKAEGGTAIVMNPKTGEILAMASYPSYTPSNFAEIAQKNPDLFQNPAISKIYEPGSVVKVVTVAAGLDTGVITPQSTYNDTGSFTISGLTIENWDRMSHGITSIPVMLQKSLNLGTVHIADYMGQAKFYKYMVDFGFGQPTGVELQGEVSGILRLPGHPRFNQADLYTNSFGQGMAATPLQVINAVAAVANGGKLLRPHIVKEYRDGNTIVAVQPTIVRQVVGSRVVHDLNEMLVGVVENEVTGAAIPGYRVAGKTGTSEIPTATGYDPRWTIGSFVAYAPADDPQIIILAKIDKPQLPLGEQTAAPAVRVIMKQTLGYLGIAPDNIRLAANQANR
ncbi:MAG: penicillin-binding protein 2 [Chloroflexi bacterium]|nr:penicillin-binding protein 2 [Chloroflexota bacterium]